MNIREVEIDKCRALFPLFAKAVRPSLSLTDFHMKYYRILHRFAKGQIKKLIVTIPPQHGKSEGSTRLLPAFLLGINPDLRIAIASYSDTFAKKFNREIQRIISEPIYQEIFPGTSLSKNRFATIENNYLRNANEFEIVGRIGSLKSFGRGGSLTGNRVDIMIMDDLYKDAMEGNSPTIRSTVIDWYNSVVVKRLHNDSQQLIVFTRWHEEDLIGYLEERQEVKTIECFDDIDHNLRGWHKINFEAIKTGNPTEIDARIGGTALWEQMHSLESLLEEKALDSHTFECMNQGNPTAKEGLLYSEAFKTYTELPSNIVKKANYTDTADMGSDVLCSICYQVSASGDIYVTDVLYSFEAMEITEPQTAKMLGDNDTRIAYIESNNGGRGFARQVKQLAPGVNVQWFTQSGNKESRILTNSATVQHRIHLPVGWDKRWPGFYDELSNFKRIFRANRQDGAADSITGIIEKEPIKQTKIRII